MFYVNIFFVMFQIKPTKLIKSSRSNRTAIGRNANPNRYASVLIITKSIPISSVTNLKKKNEWTELRTPLNYRVHESCQILPPLLTQAQLKAQPANK